MMLLVIVAFLSTSAFCVAAKRRGLPPGKFASMPFVGLGVLLVLDYLIGPLAAKLLGIWGVSGSASATITFGFSLFLGLIYLALIRYVWLEIIQADDVLVVDVAKEKDI